MCAILDMDRNARHRVRVENHRGAWYSEIPVALIKTIEAHRRLPKAGDHLVCKGAKVIPVVTEPDRQSA